MQNNRILTAKEVLIATGVDPVDEKIKYRQYGCVRLYILSDVLNYLEINLPAKKSVDIAVEDDYIIIESKINQQTNENNRTTNAHFSAKNNTTTN